MNLLELLSSILTQGGSYRIEGARVTLTDARGNKWDFESRHAAILSADEALYRARAAPESRP